MTILRSTMIPSASATKSTKSIVNRYGVSGTVGTTIATDGLAISTLSGAMTLNTLKTFLSVSGSGGQMTLLTIRTNDATARTIRAKLTIDGVAYDFTSASMSTSGFGVVIAGNTASTIPTRTPPLYWKSTFVIEVASSITETDKLTIEWIYNTEA